MQTYKELSNELYFHLMRFKQLKADYGMIEENYENVLKEKNRFKDINLELENHEAKRINEVNNIKSFIKDQEKVISGLQGNRDKNNILAKEKSALIKLNSNLKRRYSKLQKNKEKIMAEYIATSNKKMEDEKCQTNIRVKKLEEELQSIKASNDLVNGNLENKIKTVTQEFEVKLKQATDTENKLKLQIERLNLHLATTVRVYKHILSESELKRELLEKQLSDNMICPGNCEHSKNIASTSKANNQTYNASNTLETPEQIQDYIESECDKNLGRVLIKGDSKKFNRFTFRKRNASGTILDGSKNIPSSRLSSGNTSNNALTSDPHSQATVQNQSATTSTCCQNMESSEESPVPMKKLYNPNDVKLYMKRYGN